MFFERLKVLSQTIVLALAGLLMIYGGISIVQRTENALGAGTAAPKSAPVMQTGIFTGTVPSIVSYQGMLRDVEGNPLGGIHQMAFRIYDDVTNPTTEAIWAEEHTQVTVREGQFTVLLGDLNPIPPVIFQNADRFIGITVDNQDEMVPRQRFAAVPYAMAAAGATYLTAPDTDPIKAVAVDNEGKVGIGTENPSAPLHIQAAGQNVEIGPNRVTADGTFQMNANGPLQINDSTASNVSVAAGGGRVGIGTAAPGTLLHVQGDDPDLTLDFAPNSTNNLAEIRFRDNGAAKASIYYSKATDTIATTIGGTTEVVVKSGRMGIGTNNPSGRLDVNGDLRIKGQPPILIRRFINQGNNANFNTGISATDYDCVIGGYLTKYDVDESGSGVHAVWAHVGQNGNWYAHIEFASNTPGENPDVDVLCFRRELTEFIPEAIRGVDIPNDDGR